MAREVLKRAGSSAVEAGVRAMMPWFDDATKAIRDDIRVLRGELQADLRKYREELHAEVRSLDAKIDDLRSDVVDRFERLLHTANEGSHRVTRLDGRLEGHVEALRLNLQSPRTSRKRKAS